MNKKSTLTVLRCFITYINYTYTNKFQNEAVPYYLRERQTYTQVVYETKALSVALYVAKSKYTAPGIGEDANCLVERLGTTFPVDKDFQRVLCASGGEWRECFA